MIGMMAVLLSTGSWLALATFLELPVSTSHSVGWLPVHAVHLHITSAFCMLCWHVCCFNLPSAPAIFISTIVGNFNVFQRLFVLAVGSVVGMTIAIRGGDAVVWYRHAPAAFPYIKAS